MSCCCDLKFCINSRMNIGEVKEEVGAIGEGSAPAPDIIINSAAKGSSGRGIGQK